MASKIDEMRDELIQLGFSSDEIKDLDKKQLKKMLDDAKASEQLIEAARFAESSGLVDVDTAKVPDVTFDSPNESENTASQTPTPSSSSWTDYVMKLFVKEELENGLPKVDGLRRVAELVYGPFDSMVDVIQTPIVENGYRATVKVEVFFVKTGRRYSSAADVYNGNTDQKFAIHPVATAESRAEGRALRKALKLTKIVTAEEMQGADKFEPNGVSDKRANTAVLSSLKIVADRLKVDPFKLAIFMGIDIQVIDDISQAQALEMMSRLGKFQRKEEEVPENIKI